MGTMLAVRAHARGGPEQLVYKRAPVPVPTPGEVLVAVAAINFAELTWDVSWITLDGRDRTPANPGPRAVRRGRRLGRRRHGAGNRAEVFGPAGFHRDGAAAGFAAVRR